MMAHEFKLLRRLLKERSGIDLAEDKMDLVEAKLRPLMKEFAFPSFAHLTLALMKPDNDALRLLVAQAVAVLESYFFRNKTPFNYFADAMLPRLMERRARSRRIRIWCAASSTGQEPYSLAMLVADAGPRLDGWRVEIVATDFSEDALRKARQGVYSQFEVQRGLPVSMLVKHFQKAGNGWQIKPALRDKVVFLEHNLLDACEELGTFDIIFCRNVLIYFDATLKRAVLGRLSRQLASDGYLVLGASETITGLSPDFEPVPEGHHGIFCLTPGAAADRRQARDRQATGLRTGASSGGRAAPHEPWIGGVHAAGGQGEHRGPAVPVKDTRAREITLDGVTAEMLEARARARGLTLAELLTEFATAQASAAEESLGFKARTS